MRKVKRTDILSVADYEKIRSAHREKMMKIKSHRRIHVGQYLTFLFENFDTVHYQVQEMMRTENITDEAAIEHEIKTYNELIGERGSLGCTLLIEIDDPIRRGDLLTRWINLPEHIYMKMKDGTRIRPRIDERQVGETRISSVHYLRFEVGDKIPQALGCSHPELTEEKNLTAEQAVELCKDILA